jgi:hypothetical protein
MKRTTLLLLLVALAAPIVMTGMSSLKDETVRHVVVFKFSEGATAEQIQTVTDAFRGLKDSIPGILSFEHGVNNSPEGKNQGFTHVYMLTFENAAARDAYLPHPEHKKFGEVLGGTGIFEDAFVVDYMPAE